MEIGRELNYEMKRFFNAVQGLYDAIYEADVYANTIHVWKEGLDGSSNNRYISFEDYLQKAWVDEIHEEHRENIRDWSAREYYMSLFTDHVTEAEVETLRLAADGEYRWFQTRVQLLEKAEDSMIIMIYRKDIDQKKKEKELNQKREEESRKLLKEALMLAEQANNAKTDFLSHMNHDIRTPMNAIIGMTTIAMSNCHDEQKVQDCLIKIEKSSHFLLGLINDMLDLAKIESGKMGIVRTDFRIRSMLEELAEGTAAVAAEKQQTFTLSVSEEVEELYQGDEMRVRQVLMNLLSNAHKYAPQGGAYSLNVSVSKETDSLSVLRFEVEDNGIGISDEFMQRIFEPFEREENSDNRTGSGLGMAITQNLVHLMEGTLSVESQKGRGSRFIAELPLKKMEVQPEPEASAVKAEAGKMIHFRGERVLVVEDNELNQEVAQSLLEMHYLKVDLASDGVEAVRKFTAAPEGYYLAILMDIQMPRMNGYEAAKCIRGSAHPEAETIPIYAMTANAFSSDVLAAKSSGMNGHIAKPVDFREVAEELNKILEAKDN